MVDNYVVGLAGENVIREWLIKERIHFLQAEIIAKVNGEWLLFEVKHQEMFIAPPFDGHGLPAWQIKARLEFQNDTGIRALLVIVDKKTKSIYWQYMDVLVQGSQFQTKGEKPRLIFPLSSFITGYPILRMEDSWNTSA